MFLLYFPLEDRNFPLKIPNEKLGRGTFTLICYKNLQSWEVSARSKLKGENLLRAQLFGLRSADFGIRPLA